MLHAKYIVRRGKSIIAARATKMVMIQQTRSLVRRGREARRREKKGGGSPLPDCERGGLQKASPIRRERRAQPNGTEGRKGGGRIKCLHGLPGIAFRERAIVTSENVSPGEPSTESVSKTVVPISECSSRKNPAPVEEIQTVAHGFKEVEASP